MWADVVTQVEQGMPYKGIESKYSPLDSYTKNQSIVIPELVRSGDAGPPATVGSRSGQFMPGQVIQARFQGDVWSVGPNLYGR